MTVLTSQVEAKIIVIIPTYNDNARLVQCLKAIDQQTLDKSLFKVIVVDNGSSQPPELPAGLAINVNLWFESKPGSYAARNKALNGSKAEFYAFTDSDCKPDPDWLQAAYEVLSQSSCDAVSGPIELFCHDDNNPKAIELIDLLKGFPQQKTIHQQHYSPTANLIVKAKCFDEVGLFNDNLKSGGDKEWCLRLHQQGGVLIYDQRVKIRHPARDTFQQYLTKQRRIAHGAWARRDSDPLMKKYTGVHGIVTGIMPPVRKGYDFLTRFPQAKISTRLKAIICFYAVNLYSVKERLKCRFGLVQSVERN
ncbi:glycosyltransferase [Neiella sp. HB171785]|uniref:Glycosyltransferase n=1 Tax=Neiella litorisoli TaxID=2771431 RepID=A0A8J6UGQ5_9GAMM|nr:glycosyltransferase [Neiella litorisoli]MBD1390556.1 glycosyltransferase [Neiella litorisoli]